MESQQKSKKTVHFCLPIFNEEKILKNNTLKLLNFCKNCNFNFSWKIILIINGSTDNSFNVSKKLAIKHPDKIITHKSEVAGRGLALKDYWLITDSDIACYMDIDLAVALENIPNLLYPLLQNNYDLAIGSRLLPDSKIERSFIRELSSQTYNFFSKIILKHNFSDLQCGFKAIKIYSFKKIAPNIKSTKWFFDTELITFAKRLNYHIKEIPVNWSENRYEDRISKVNIIRDSLKFLFNLLKLRIQLWKIKKTLH